MLANQSTKLSRVRANSKNSGRGPNQPLTLSDEHSKHLQPTRPHPNCIFLQVFGLFFSVIYIYKYIYISTHIHLYIYMYLVWNIWAVVSLNQASRYSLDYFPGVYHDNIFFFNPSLCSSQCVSFQSAVKEVRGWRVEDQLCCALAEEPRASYFTSHSPHL